MKWTINPTTLDEAREILEITYPVRVRVLEDGIAGMAGKYHGLAHWGPTSEERLDEPTHHITVAGHLDAKFANKCLWHELTHAAQCEDFLPDDPGEGDYRIANKRLRCAFRDEMREIRARKGGSKYGAISPDYAGVSFEVEARDVMDDSDKLLIIEPVGTEDEANDAPAKKDDPLKGYNACWRVDVWDDRNKFIATQYVLADDDFDAKRFARTKWLDGKWSGNVVAHEINPRTGRK